MIDGRCLIAALRKKVNAMSDFITKVTILIVAIGLAAIALGYGKSLQQRMLKALNNIIKGGILHDATFSISYVNIFTVHNRLIHYFNQLSSRLFFRNARCDLACASVDNSLIISSVIASYACNSIGLNFSFNDCEIRSHRSLEPSRISFRLCSTYPFLTNLVMW